MKNNKGFATQSVLLVLLVIALVVIGYLVGKKDSFAPTKIDEPTPLEVIDQNQNTNQQNTNIQQENNTETNVQNNQPKYSTTLPEYIGGQEGWPPVIQNLTTKYSCTPEHTEIGDTIEKNINGKKYCVSIFIDAGAGQRYGEYTYITTYGSGTKKTHFILHWSDCGVYGGPTDVQRIKCQASQDGFLNNLDALITSLM